MLKSSCTFMVFLIFCLMLGSVALAAASCRTLVEQTREAILTESQVYEIVKKSKDYQDKRNEDWSEKNKCLCCHTTLPFMFSRGLDAKSQRLFDNYQDMAAKKVMNPAAEPWYAADYQQRSSKPTEAVLNALTLLMYDISANTPLRAVTIKSIDRIFENSDLNGKIHWLDFNLQPFESKKGELWGNSMAILAIELAQKKSAYRAPVAEYNKLKSYVLENSTQLKPNEMAVLIWADSVQLNHSSLEKQILSVEKFNKFVSEIISVQNPNGSWSQKSVLGYGQVHADGYSTAIALIGLVKAGHGHSAAAHKAAEWLTAAQITQNVLNMGQNYSLWLANSMNRTNVLLNNRFASDTATSYASLALQMYRENVLLP